MPRRPLRHHLKPEACILIPAKGKECCGLGRRIWRAAVLVLLLPVMCLGAWAAEGTGRVHVCMRRGETPVGGTVVLYRVGVPMEAGYQLGESFGGGIVRQEDALSPHLAQWLGEMTGADGMVRELDEGGCADFENLGRGLYLLVQTRAQAGYDRVRPFLMELPYQGEWEITALPKTREVAVESPATGQHPAPILGAMGMVLAGMGLIACGEWGRRNKDR